MAGHRCLRSEESECNSVSQMFNNKKQSQSWVMVLCLPWWEQRTWPCWHFILGGLEVKECHFLFVTRISEMQMHLDFVFPSWRLSGVLEQCRWIEAFKCRWIKLPFSTRGSVLKLPRSISPAQKAHRTLTSLLALTSSSKLPFFWVTEVVSLSSAEHPEGL